MDYKIKSRLMLGIVFILGGILGYLFKDLVVKSPYDQIRILRSKGGIVHRFENILNLTEEQKKELKPILENHENKIMEIAEKSREEIRKTMDTFEQEVKPYLSDEQIKQLTDEFNFRVPFPGPEGRGNFLKERLNLTDAQFEKIKEIYLKEEEKIRSLAPEFPEGNGGRPFEHMEKIIEETKKEILKILDDDQKEKFKKIEDERRKGDGFIIRGGKPEM